MAMKLFLLIAAILFILFFSKCVIKKDSGNSYHQILINNTNHNIFLKVFVAYRSPEIKIIPSNNILELHLYAPVRGDFLPFNDYLDSIQVFVDTFYCNTYYNCYHNFIFGDSVLRRNCINDSFNLAIPEYYKCELIGEYEANAVFLIDEKFCKHCK
jgi:hypothetical protein